MRCSCRLREGGTFFWVTYSIVQLRYLLVNEKFSTDFRPLIDTIGSSLRKEDMLPFLVAKYANEAIRLSVHMKDVLCRRTPDEASELVLDFSSQIRNLDSTYQLESYPSGDSLDIQFWDCYRGARIKVHHFLILFINYAETAGQRLCLWTNNVGPVSGQSGTWDGMCWIVQRTFSTRWG